MKKLILLILISVNIFGSCDESLESPETLDCSNFTIDIGKFDSPCCSYNTNNMFDIMKVIDDFDDFNITTKIVDEKFTLNLASLEDNRSQYKEFNGTVCTQVIDSDDNNKTDWVKSLFEDDNITTIDFNSSMASKINNIYIVWKKDVDENCPLSDAKETNSSDDFAIRPKKFMITTSADTLKAGKDFTLSFLAGLDSSNLSDDYNESNTTDASFDINISEQKVTCNTGSFSPAISDVVFEDGNKSFTLSYDDVGKIDINISEEYKNDDEIFAKVDRDDKDITSAILRIERADKTISITPHHFNIDIISSNKNSLFTYLAKDIEKMNAIVDINITAQDENNNTTKNYNTDCYANKIKVDFEYSEVDSRLNKFIYYYTDSSIISSNNVNNPLTYDLNKTYFKTDNNGSAIYQMHYNFDRNKSTPINPFDINITKFDVEDSNDSTINGTDSDTNSSNFCFGRIRAKDVKTDLDQNLTYTIELEIYDNNSSSTSYTGDFKQNSLKWYLHQNHNNSDEGNIVEINATKNTILKDEIFQATISDPKNGNIQIEIPKDNLGSYILHIKTQPWLWHTYKNFGDDYNDSEGSNCTQHPCFNYILRSKSSDNVKSGNFSGANINIEKRKNYTKDGVKTFR